MNDTDALQMRGRGWFRQYLWTDQDERYQRWIERGGLLPVEREPKFRATWCVRRDSPLIAKALRWWYGPLRDAYWNAVYRMWAWGLFEPEEGAVFSWRRDFRPFPWRGLKRERPHRSTHG